MSRAPVETAAARLRSAAYLHPRDRGPESSPPTRPLDVGFSADCERIPFCCAESSGRASDIPGWIVHRQFPTVAALYAEGRTALRVIPHALLIEALARDMIAVAPLPQTIFINTTGSTIRPPIPLFPYRCLASRFVHDGDGAPGATPPLSSSSPFCWRRSFSGLVKPF